GGFAAYGFCKSHAAAFAMLTYQSAWLRLYHAPEFYAALLNNQPMGFYSPEVIVNEARRRGVPVLPVEVNQSRARCTIEGPNPPFTPGRGRPRRRSQYSASPPTREGGADPRDTIAPPFPHGEGGRGGLGIRLGLRYVKGLGPAAQARLDAERACGPYRSLADFCRRGGLPRAAIENLIVVGAF